MTTAADDEPGVYAVIAEFKNDGPILLETSSRVCSRAGADQRMEGLLSSPNCIRAAVVRLKYEVGNELILTDMKRIQE